ncbi:MAG: glycosyltransferase [Brumimicrobium sp.]|nr:glycosyltransferase [Brumimicrobium sp.]
MEIFPDFSDLNQSVGNYVVWLLVFVQLFWLLFFYLRIVIHKEKNNETLPPISVIIAAKNEEENLQEFLPAILEQNYPEFEVIVINHQSRDSTLYILKDFEKRYPNLRIIDIQDSTHLMYGKKLPITLGVKGAKYENLLFTDADCRPTSSSWIREMAAKYSEQKSIVLGYAPYEKKEGFLNKWIRIDTTFIALNYLSYAKAGIPYMGVGRNLAYTKDLFMTNGGFKMHYTIASGDDDLFIQEVVKNKNYTISLSPDSFCYSEPEITWENWMSQKGRHLTTAPRYPLIKKLLLGIYPLSVILLFLSFVPLLVLNWFNWFTIGLIGVLISVKWIVLGMAFKRLEQKSFMGSILFWDFFYAFFAPIIYFKANKTTKKKWK